MSTYFTEYGISLLSIIRVVPFLSGALGTFIGIRSILAPASYAPMFGFHPSTQIARSAESNPFIPVSGGRVLASALATLGCAWLKADRATGVTLMTAVVTGAVDAYAVLKYSGLADDAKGSELKDAQVEKERVELARSSAAGHFIATSVITVVGAWLVLYGET